MSNFDCRKNPVHVSRDAGYSKIESISPENRRKAREMMDNGHFDEYVKLGYSTDRKGLQEMIASEKLIKDSG